MIRRTATIHLFYCANSMAEGELQGLQTRLETDGLRTLSLPCSGKATIPYLLKAFEKGADGVLLCTCPEPQCKHLEGNLRASKRAEAVDGLLDEIGLGKGHVVVVAKEQGQSGKLVDAIQRLRAACSVLVNDLREERRKEGQKVRKSETRTFSPSSVPTFSSRGRENAA